MNYLQEEDYNQKVNLKIWKRLLKYALRRKWLVAGLLASLFVSSLMEVIYPRLNMYAIDNFVVKKTTDGMLLHIIIYVCCILMQTAASILFVRWGSKLELGMSYDIRQESFEKLQNLSFSYYDKTSVGYINYLH